MSIPTSIVHIRACHGLEFSKQGCFSKNNNAKCLFDTRLYARMLEEHWEEQKLIPMKIQRQRDREQKSVKPEPKSFGMRIACFISDNCVVRAAISGHFGLTRTTLSPNGQRI